MKSIMATLSKCRLYLTRSFFEGRSGRRLVNSFALIQNLCVNRLLIPSPRSFLAHRGHAAPDSNKAHQLAIFEKRKEGAFVEDEHVKKVSDILNCSVEKAQMLCLKHDFLYVINLGKFQEKVELMLSYGVPYSVIQTNLRTVWNVSVESLSQRLQLMQRLSILDHRHTGFYLYCSKKQFEQGIANVQEYRQALDGCANVVEYTQRRLNVSEVEAEKFLSMSPFKGGYSPVRLKSLFDFFYFEAKVNSQYLQQNFVLFNYSSERLRYRLKIMRRAGIKNSGLWKKFWRCTPSEFNNTFARFIEEKA